MHNASHEIKSVEDAARKAVTETIFSPRFYTTDFAAMDAINIEPVRAEWDAMMAEYEGDNNHDHFQRDATFADEARDMFAKLPHELQQDFLDF
ncbi:MAG: magnesium-protoporphyrin IX monomethyl ester (oxidative) cyclase, partial [Burkholderiaceae bacterium]